MKVRRGYKILKLMIQITIMLIMGSLLNGNLVAQERIEGIQYGEERGTRKTPGIRKRFFSDYLKAVELIQLDPPQYDEALEILLDQNFERGFNPYEKAAFYNSIATIYLYQQKYVEALKYYKLVLQQEYSDKQSPQDVLPSGAKAGFQTIGASSGSEIPYDLLDGVYFLIGQIYFIIEEYENSLPYFNEWYIQQDNPASHNLIFIANAYYYAGNLDDISIAKITKYNRFAIKLINRSISIEKFKGNIGKESWYLFLRTLHGNFEEDEQVLEITEFLVTNWLKKVYFIELSGLYAKEAGKEHLSTEDISKFEMKQMVAMELAHRQGVLTKGRELESMAQMFLYHDIPYKSAKTIAASLESGASDKNYKNYNLLSVAYIKGQDRGKAIEPLNYASALSDDGNLYMRLANLHLQLDQYDNAVDAIERAISKGGLRRPDLARFLQGQAYIYIQQFDLSRNAFREAAKDERTQKNANTWLQYIDSEEKRIEGINEYLSDR